MEDRVSGDTVPRMRIPTHPRRQHGGRAARWRRLFFLTATLVMLAALIVRLVQELL